MKWYLWLVTIWIPIGRMYINLWYIFQQRDMTWRKLITEREYRIMIIDSGLFGVATPIIKYKSSPKSKHPKIVNKLARWKKVKSDM